MSAISAAAVSLRTLADGTMRITVDVEPKDAAEAFALFGKPGQPVALAALRDGHAAIPAEPKAKLGPLCLEAVRYCEMPEFWEFLDVSGSNSAKAVIRTQCGINSRKELDEDLSAGNEFTRYFRTPFMKYMREKHG